MDQPGAILGGSRNRALERCTRWSPVSHPPAPGKRKEIHWQCDWVRNTQLCLQRLGDARWCTETDAQSSGAKHPFVCVHMYLHGARMYMHRYTWTNKCESAHINMWIQSYTIQLTHNKADTRWKVARKYELTIQHRTQYTIQIGFSRNPCIEGTTRSTVLMFFEVQSDPSLIHVYSTVVHIFNSCWYCHLFLAQSTTQSQMASKNQELNYSVPQTSVSTVFQVSSPADTRYPTSAGDRRKRS